MHSRSILGFAQSVPYHNLCCSCLFVSQVFPDVTILFSDVVKFNEICIHITPMQVVDMLNEIYIVFDTLSEKHNVYKVSPLLNFTKT